MELWPRKIQRVVSLSVSMPKQTVSLGTFADKQSAIMWLQLVIKTLTPRSC